MSNSPKTLRIAATLAGAALALGACGKANVATPEPGDGARGFVADRAGARQASARTSQTPSYGQPGAAPTEMHESRGSTPTASEPTS